MADKGRVTAVCVMHAPRASAKRAAGVSGIDKRPVDGPWPVGELGLEGDAQFDTANHGGPWQAVYAYADEDAAWWAAELDREIPPGLFGENLRIAGLDVNAAEIGERWRVGEVLTEVTGSRNPCVTFADVMDEPQWVKRFGQRRLNGAYLRVLRTGTVRAGDEVTVEHRPGHGITVADTGVVKDPTTMARLLRVAGELSIELNPRLAEDARRVARRA